MSWIFRAPSLREIGIAAGLVSLFVFGILYGQTGNPAALIAGCGGGMTLLIASVLASRSRPESNGPPAWN
jgi:MFS superfamily sulfate permease-like transporter